MTVVGLLGLAEWMHREHRLDLDAFAFSLGKVELLHLMSHAHSEVHVGVFGWCFTSNQLDLLMWDSADISACLSMTSVPLTLLGDNLQTPRESGPTEEGHQPDGHIPLMPSSSVAATLPAAIISSTPPQCWQHPFCLGMAMLGMQVSYLILISSLCPAHEQWCVSSSRLCNQKLPCPAPREEDLPGCNANQTLLWLAWVQTGT